MFECVQYFNSEDVPTAVQSSDQGLVDIAEQLIARFGGELRDRWAQPKSGTDGE